jgi:hypothetical protein
MVLINTAQNAESKTSVYSVNVLHLVWIRTENVMNAKICYKIADNAFLLQMGALNAYRILTMSLLTNIVSSANSLIINVKHAITFPNVFPA